MDMVQIIRKKRDGQKLGKEEIETFVHETAKGKTHSAQIGALLMAIYYKGLSDDETFFLTDSMIKSGKQLNWPFPTADKHSTGGVGDKVSIALVPALAAAGLHIPMISGRGLDFTGGTLDKLESIPGYSVEFTEQQMSDSLKECGCFIAATTDQLCPADKILYSIRDTTATVDSTPLIIGSIVSKKIAEGADCFVLDLKIGKATFFKNEESARDFGKRFVSISQKFGCKARVILTRMENPLGQYIGNALEIKECVEIMKGRSPKDLHTLITHLGGQLLHLAKKVDNVMEGEKIITETLRNGAALRHFKQMMICHGVDEDNAHEMCFGDCWKVMKKAAFMTPFMTKSSGWISSINALQIGMICRDLGGGRKSPGDEIDYSVGAVLEKTVGDYINQGEKWLTLHHNKTLNDNITARIKVALSISQEPVTNRNIIIDVISSPDV